VGDPLFPRLESMAKAEAPKPEKKPEAPKKAPAPEKKPTVTDDTIQTIQYDDFAKLDLRVAKVLTAEKHPDADRLLKLTVDAGDGRERTICAGLAAYYTPEEMVGKTVVLLANLAPRKIRGVMSEGMLLAAGQGEVVKLLAVPGDLPPGTKIS
jgi:methionyl-tRNA synthetase